jgi:hypothetical protein
MIHKYASQLDDVDKITEDLVKQGFKVLGTSKYKNEICVDYTISDNVDNGDMLKVHNTALVCRPSPPSKKLSEIPLKKIQETLW